MTSIKRSLLVPYSPGEMFELVNRIEEYPQFLPWCKETMVHSRTIDEVKASITVAKGGIHQTFTTLNRLQHNKMIEVRLIKGPFRHLQGFWKFEEVPDVTQSLITFDLEFEFSNRLIAITVGPILEKIAESFIDAFHQRATEVYRLRELDNDPKTKG